MKRAIFALGICFLIVVFGCILYGMSRIREFGQRDEWKGCSLTAVKMAENRSNDVTTPTADSHSNF